MNSTIRNAAPIAGASAYVVARLFSATTSPLGAAAMTAVATAVFPKIHQAFRRAVESVVVFYDKPAIAIAVILTTSFSSLAVSACAFRILGAVVSPYMMPALCVIQIVSIVLAQISRSSDAAPV